MQSVSVLRKKILLIKIQMKIKKMKIIKNFQLKEAKNHSSKKALQKKYQQKMIHKKAILIKVMLKKKLKYKMLHKIIQILVKRQIKQKYFKIKEIIHNKNLLLIFKMGIFLQTNVKTKKLFIRIRKKILLISTHLRRLTKIVNLLQVLIMKMNLKILQILHHYLQYLYALNKKLSKSYIRPSLKEKQSLNKKNRKVMINLNKSHLKDKVKDVTHLKSRQVDNHIQTLDSQIKILIILQFPTQTFNQTSR
ncbi:hypothetical protein TTHERM_000151188 (macronuclear) [Tetrahymena thermophila SB210]|uniref:Uncharacterized protein n=1 Tax=Tetrahymena thermophila (strain SB210) TaxID=312017 RepID=W7X6M3_TETTS|nr:hypothetical protein TTHERM_000151188 [Tetrahymena thermophila SB210]EWS73037.1 hypothetical protein TTHERM_000151188 [Tetrahymena thermophila SB210]|eukprot:XP_012654434.1 hypothetical protein TTHERM_000151188 [Tetrahymena thermophila SB210]